MSALYGRAVSVEPYEKEPDTTIENEAGAVKIEDPKHASQSGARPKNLATGRRPITHVPDKHDRMVLDLKSQGIGDTQIARILNHDGGNYDSKTIGTRYRRLRLTVMAHNDEPLKRREMHWTEKEDTLLLKSHSMNDEKHQELHANIDRRFFEDVAFSINDVEKDTFYSPDACNERYHALMNGTAKPHPDQDKDPHRARDDMAKAIEVDQKKEGNFLIKKAVEWENTLLNETQGKRVCKTGMKRASGKRRPKGQSPAKKQKVGKQLSEELISPEDDIDSSCDEVTV